MNWVKGLLSIRPSKHISYCWCRPWLKTHII